MMKMNEKITQQLVKEATKMLKNAYVPYSNFPVGASLITDDGIIYSGCNIENASYGLSNCAERTAIFKAISEGKKSFKQIVVTGKTNGPISPCGACRQVMVEFCEPDMPVLLTNTNGDKYETTVKELLPGAFQSEDMV